MPKMAVTASPALLCARAADPARRVLAAPAEASYIPSNVTRPRPGGRHCVWLGGACVEGVRRDCPETVPTHLQTSFYGEQAALSSGATCRTPARASRRRSSNTRR